MPRQAVDLIKHLGGHGFSVAANSMAENWQAMTEEVKVEIELQWTSIGENRFLLWEIKSWFICVGRGFQWAL